MNNKKAFLSILIAIALLLSLCIPVLADTGTYKIDKYRIILIPREDGKVHFYCEQEWTCLSGYLDHILVGTPNSNFQIGGSGGNAVSFGNEKSKGFVGVYLGLDKKYQAGEKFKVDFTIYQEDLLERFQDQDYWSINLTPGWYDNATIDLLEVSLRSPVSLESYTFSPPPTSTENLIANWVFTNLEPGTKVNLLIESTDSTFLKLIPKPKPPAPTSTAKSTEEGVDWPTSSLVVLVVSGALLLIGVPLLFLSLSRKRSPKVEKFYLRDIEVTKIPTEEKKPEGFVSQGAVTHRRRSKK